MLLKRRSPPPGVRVGGRAAGLAPRPRKAPGPPSCDTLRAAAFKTRFISVFSASVRDLGIYNKPFQQHMFLAT